MIRIRRLSALALASALLAAPSARPAFAQVLGDAAAPAQAAAAAPAAVPYFTEPALSPDRSEIAFVSGGDIWTVPTDGGAARLLVSHPADERRPLYSPDGRSLAFTSTRTGNGDLYVLALDAGDLRRVTFDDGPDQLDAWSPDGRWLYFSSTSRDIAGMNDIFRVSPLGGTPMQVSADRYTNEFFSAPSPDGSALAFSARGISSGQWWRKGSSHIDESEIWVARNLDAGSSPTYEQVAERGARQTWPMWAADGRRLFYVSDRGGAQNIWSRAAGQPARQVTSFRDGRVLWPSISRDGRLIVFERDFRVWKLDTESGRAAEVPITRRGAPSGPAVEHVRLSDNFDEFALSPDGKKVAFVVRGEVFAASSTDGGDAARVTQTPQEESQLTWSPDSRRLAYVSDRDGTAHLYSYDFSTNKETQLTSGASPDDTPRYSPDGKHLAFQRDGKELRVLTLATKQERLVASGTFDRPPVNPDRPFAWSPDSKWIAYAPIADKLFRNVHVVAGEGGTAPKPASFLANAGGAGTVSWSPDGTFLLFNTGQRTEPGQLARVDLIPRTPKFREDQFRDLFREETPRNLSPRPAEQERPAPTQTEGPPATATPTPPATATPTPTPAPSPAAEGQARPGATPAPKPVEVVFEGIRERLSLLPVGIDVNYQAISPDGKWVVLIAAVANQLNLYVYSLDELAREPAVAKQLTSTAGFKAQAQFSPDSKEVFYLEAPGRIGVVNLEGRARPLALMAEMDVDFSTQKAEVFTQVWTYLRDHFYDPGYHGADWRGLRAEYEPRVAGARTPEEMRRLLNLMIGELNASHLGVSGPGSAVVTSTGRLGLRFDRVEYEQRGRLRVGEVIPLSPAALGGVKPGDYLLAVDGRALDARTNLDEVLNFKINRRVSLAVASSAEGADRREVAVRPVNSATEKALLYRKWVEDNRAYVARASNGRLGYVHMFDMSSGSLAQLHVDLDAENHAREGVVVDVRNNNGGFVNVYAIDVLARRGYLTMTPRGQGSAPGRTVLGQRSLERPTVLVTNQHSLSDAEDFTEGYRSLRLGKVVGEPTAGWIIYTWNTGLIDGGTVRLPRMKVTDNAGADMELAPRPVDVPATRPVGETYAGKDSQLDAAVRELLGQLGDRTSRRD